MLEHSGEEPTRTDSPPTSPHTTQGAPHMTQTIANPASDKQLAFIGKLLAERVNHDVDALAQYGAVIPKLTTKSASELIDHLLALPAPAPLAYQGPEADHVMVSKRHGKCDLCGHPTFAGQAHASVVATVWSSYHFAGECPEGEAPTDSDIDFRSVCEEFGAHRNSPQYGPESYTLWLADPVHVDGQVSGETRLKVKVRYTPNDDKVTIYDACVHGQGNYYGQQKPGLGYVGQASDTLARMLADVKAAAAAYGQLNSHCGICGLALTGEESISRGVGPICWDKYYG